MSTNDPMLAREMSVGVMQNAIEEYLNSFGEEDVIGGAGGSQMTQAKKDKLQELLIPQIQAHAARFTNQARQ